MIDPITGEYRPDALPELPNFGGGPQAGFMQGALLPQQPRALPSIAQEQMAGGMPGGPQAQGMEPISFQAQMWDNIVSDKQRLTDMQNLSGGLQGVDMGLSRFADALQGPLAQQVNGAPYRGGQIQPPENPGITQLIQLLQSSNRGGWGR